VCWFKEELDGSKVDYVGIIERFWRWILEASKPYY
jgi:hypothetical protein